MSQLKVHIGIDIGKQGAIVGMIEGRIFKHPMPMIKSELDYAKLCEIIFDLSSTNIDAPSTQVHVVFERLGVIFGTSKATAFSMGHQAGAVEMLCVVNRIPFTKVPPKEWQKEMFLGVDEILKSSKSGKTKVRDTKAMALLAVKRLFPKESLTFGEKAEKPHDGLVDALLMCEFARRRYS